MFPFWIELSTTTVAQLAAIIVASVSWLIALLASHGART
jgi:hypothetical protein